MTEIDRPEPTFLEPLALRVAAGATIRAAAADAGCSEATAYRIAGTEPFRRRVAELRYRITDRAVGLLAEGSARAVSALVELLDSDDDATKLAAAKAILGLLPRVAEHCELRARLDRLENHPQKPQGLNDAIV